MAADNCIVRPHSTPGLPGVYLHRCPPKSSPLSTSSDSSTSHGPKTLKLDPTALCTTDLASSQYRNFSHQPRQAGKRAAGA